MQHKGCFFICLFAESFLSEKFPVKISEK